MNAQDLVDRCTLAPSGCWEWQGSRLWNGYGRFSGRNGFIAHRRMYELTKGEIPEGWFVCHTCDNPPCINPDHLFVGTALHNNRDTNRKGRHPKNGTESHCHRGHERAISTHVFQCGASTCWPCDIIRWFRREGTIDFIIEAEPI